MGVVGLISNCSPLITHLTHLNGFKHVVREKDDSTVREAALREIMRGGQVYFLHNQVETIDKVAEDLAKLIPEARLTVAASN